MTEHKINELIASVNRRRTDGSVSPVHTPEAHLQLVADFNKLVAAGYQLGHEDEWHKVTTTPLPCPFCGTIPNDHERRVLDRIAVLWNEFNALQPHENEDKAEFRQCINRAAAIIAVRIARRVNPELWTPDAEILGQNVQSASDPTSGRQRRTRGRGWNYRRSSKLEG